MFLQLRPSKSLASPRPALHSLCAAPYSPHPPLHIFRVTSPCASPASLASPRPTHQLVLCRPDLCTPSDPPGPSPCRPASPCELVATGEQREAGAPRSSARAPPRFSTSHFSSFPETPKSASGRPARSPSRIRTAVTARRGSPSAREAFLSGTTSRAAHRLDIACGMCAKRSDTEWG